MSEEISDLGESSKREGRGSEADRRSARSRQVPAQRSDDLLRRRAAGIDSGGTEGDLGAVWRAILEGELTIADHFTTAERWYLVLRACVAKAARPRARLLLTRVLLGESQKSAALETRCSKSTVSVSARDTLAALGVRATASKAPPTLALLARAGMGGETVPGRFSRMEHAGTEYRVVSVERPRFRQGIRLSPSEQDVINQFVDGKSYVEIARARDRSIRTVANQITGVFRRLRLSGRSELIACLVAGGGGSPRSSSNGEDMSAG
jgi:DNA-binding CsgD family transcriptional regulator